MFLYLFLLATIIASSENLETNSEIKELIEACALKESCTASTPDTQEASVQAKPEKNIALSDKKELMIEIATASATQQESSTEQSSITITNAIESSMLAYKHWTGTYSPEKFTITIDGTIIAQGEHYKFPVSQSTVQIRYDYSFMNGMRTGAKIVSYQLHENITATELTFSWKESCKVLLESATLIKEEVV